jgi:hypothetical protein
MSIVILDTSMIENGIDYGGMLFALKNVKVRDGQEYQIDNGLGLLMDFRAYKKCRNILNKFGVKAINLSDLST